MEEYKVTYTIEKKGDMCTRKVDRTLPMFLQGSDALLRGSDSDPIAIPMENILFRRAEETGKPIKLELIYRVTE